MNPGTDPSPKSARRPWLEPILVALVCLTGAGYGAQRLYEDFNASGAAGVGKALAKVSRKAAKVRRKGAGSYVWANVRSGEELYKKDSVQTSNGSAAAIQFDDGSTLEVGENSLVVIDDLTNLSLNFLRGQVVVRDKSGADKRISVGTDGKTKVENLPIRLSYPTPQSYFWTAEHSLKPIKFTWQAQVNARPDGKADEKFVLQISSEREFRADKTQTYVSANSSVREQVASLAAGHYYWRVIGGGATTGASGAEVRQFRVMPVVAMKPVFPTAQQKVASFGSDGAIQFRLGNLKLPQIDGVDSSELAADSEHRIEVARDAEFKNIVLSERVDPTSGVASIKGLGEGAHFWRIKSRYGDVATVSAAAKFEVQKTAKPTLELSSPQAGASVELRPQLRFNWYCETSRELDYLFELSTPDGRAVLNAKSKSFSFAWKNAPAGNYRWRVSAFSGEQSVVQTPWRALSVVQGKPLALRTPTKNQAIHYWTKPEEFQFAWSPDAALEDHEHRYVLELSADSGFRTIAHAQTLTTSASSSLALGVNPGTWNWRVRVTDKNGQTVKASEPQMFSYGIHPPLAAPKSTKPETGAALNLLDMDGDPILSWGAVEGARQYEVIVFKEVPSRKPASVGAPKSENQLLLRSKVNGTSLVLKDFKPGKYQWSVRAIDPIQRPGELLPYQKVQMTLGDPLAPPESLTPEVQ